ncbi:MAG: cache domain-containing protein [Lachnospiraceae bacterium]|nr:cache domain-containing protein [Lachnospiraceae bacterium]
MKKGISIRVQLLMMAILPVLIVGVVLTVMSAIFIKNGMESEVEEGLMAVVEEYEDILEDVPEREEGDNALEDELKADTGYDFTQFKGDTRAHTSVVKPDGTRPIGTQATPEIISTVIGGKQKTSNMNTDVAGQRYAVAYVPIIKDGAVEGMAFAGKPYASVSKEISASILSIVIVGIVLIIIVVVIVFMMAGKLVAAVKVAAEVIDHLANGEFVKAEQFTTRGDELGDMIRETNALIDTLSNIVSNIKLHATDVGSSSKELADTANQISMTADGVSNAVQEIATGATQQADEIQHATENVGNIGEAIINVSENVENLQEINSAMNSNSQKSSEAISNLKTSSDGMSSAIIDIAERINATSAAVDRINAKIENINNIASQTNLLALNASIEAARAGEAGKGFAVVAEEIGSLATESATTADEIKDEMNTLLKESQSAVSSANEVQKANDGQREVLEQTVEIINELIANIEQAEQGSRQIAESADICVEGKNEIVGAMDSLSAISEENAASTQETSASMQELNATVNTLASAADNLNDVAKQMNDEIAFFKD